MNTQDPSKTAREALAEFFRDDGYTVTPAGFVYCGDELMGKIRPDATFNKIRLVDHCDHVLRKWDRVRGLIHRLVAGETAELEAEVDARLEAGASKVADAVLADTAGHLY